MWELIGHEKQIQYLENDIEQHSLKHAYLFTGQEKIGKFTLVKRFIKILQCPSKGCDHCDICRQIDLGSHADTIIVKDHSGESIKVDDVREIIRKTQMTFDSPYFVIAIENIERMTEESSNALLKTLEEPPENVIFLLTTKNKNRLLPTILSRVFYIELNGIRVEDIRSYLTGHFPQESKQKIEQVILLSLHKPGLAIEMMKDKDLFESRLYVYNQVKQMIEGKNISESLSFIDELHDQYKNDAQRLKHALINMLELLLHLLRLSFLHTIQNETSFFISVRRSTSDILRVIEKTEEAISLIEKNINKKLVLENLILNL